MHKDSSVANLIQHGFLLVDHRSALGTPVSGMDVIPLQPFRCVRDLQSCVPVIWSTQFSFSCCCPAVNTAHLSGHSLYLLYIIQRQIFLLMSWVDLCAHLSSYPTTASCFSASCPLSCNSHLTNHCLSYLLLLRDGASLGHRLYSRISESGWG